MLFNAPLLAPNIKKLNSSFDTVGIRICCDMCQKLGFMRKISVTVYVANNCLRYNYRICSNCHSLCNYFIVCRTPIMCSPRTPIYVPCSHTYTIYVSVKRI